jgi:hypothetical protein
MKLKIERVKNGVAIGVGYRTDYKEIHIMLITHSLVLDFWKYKK